MGNNADYERNQHTFQGMPREIFSYAANRLLVRKSTDQPRFRVGLVMDVLPAYYVGKFLCDERKVIAAGFPFPVDVVWVVTSDFRKLRGKALNVATSKRYVRYLGDWESDGGQPRIEMKGRIVDAYHEVGMNGLAELGIPVACVDPNSPEGKEQLDRWSAEGRQHNTVFGGPSDYWIGYNLRQPTGELSYPTGQLTRDGKRRKRSLYHVDYDGMTLHSAGCCVQEHPITANGGRKGLHMAGGSEVVQFFMSKWLRQFCHAMFFTSPRMFDHVDYWDNDGPVYSFDDFDSPDQWDDFDVRSGLTDELARPFNYRVPLCGIDEQMTGLRIARSFLRALPGTIMGSEDLKNGLATALVDRFYTHWLIEENQLLKTVSQHMEGYHERETA